MYKSLQLCQSEAPMNSERTHCVQFVHCHAHEAIDLINALGRLVKMHMEDVHMEDNR
jgi:hypothetical protein